MGKYYSVDLRERVLKEVLTGGTVRQIAARFEVSPSFVSRLHALYRKTGSVMPLPQGGDRHSGPIEAHRDWLLARVTEEPDITLKELQGELVLRGLEVSHVAIHNFLKRHSLTFKKRQDMQQSKTGPM